MGRGWARAARDHHPARAWGTRARSRQLRARRRGRGPRERDDGRDPRRCQRARQRDPAPVRDRVAARALAAAACDRRRARRVCAVRR